VIRRLASLLFVAPYARTGDWMAALPE